MPAKSQAQRAYLAVHFGARWMDRHHFDNRGRLPEHVKRNQMSKQSDRARKVAVFVGKKRKPGEVSDVRSSNPGTKGIEGAKAYKSKSGYQIPTANDSARNPYRR